MAMDATDSIALDCKGDQRCFARTDADYPLRVLYCGVCSLPTENPNSTPESTTIQKQRKELQLLIAELKERDKELNDMVAVHQRQLLAWEDDRQKILTLAEPCSRLEKSRPEARSGKTR